MRNVSGEILGYMNAIAQMQLIIIMSLFAFIMIMKVLKNGRQVYGKQIRNKLKIMLKTINDMKKKIDIYFQKVLAHSGDYYNEVADGWLKKAVGIKNKA